MGGSIIGFLKGLTLKQTPVDDQTNPLPVSLTGGNLPVTWTAPQTYQANNIKAVTTPMVILQNATAADAVNTEQRSPAVQWQGSYYSGGAAHAMAATLDLEAVAGGSGTGPALVVRTGQTAGGIAFGANFSSIIWPSSTGVYDGAVDAFRGSYGHGNETLNFENYDAAGGYAFVTSLGAVVFSVADAALCFDKYTATPVGLGNAAFPWNSLNTTVLTVATLPAAATAGAGCRAFVSDATLALAAATVGTAVVGGGGFKTPVWSDGAAWLFG